jgi:hypothetical protein
VAHIVGIGFPVEYLGKRWRVSTITKRFVVLAEVKGGAETGRTTRVELPVFERLTEKE